MLVVGGIMLFLAQSTYWINHTVFDQESFTQITTDALLVEESRDALAREVVGRALAERPLLERAIGSQAQSLIGGLLGTDLSTRVISGLAYSVYGYVTAPNRQDLTFDLSPIQQPIASLMDVLKKANVDVADQVPTIPGEIVIVESDSLPDVARVIRVALIAGPMLWIASAALFVGYVLLDRKRYAPRIYIALGTIGVVGILALYFGPYIPQIVASYIAAIDLRVVAVNLVNGLLTPFTQQIWVMLAIASLCALIFSQRNNMLRAARAIERRIDSQRIR